MFRIVKIGDKEVPMLAMASVNIYYKRVFGIDPLVLQDGSREMTPGENINLYLGMGFIMAKMAELKDRQKMRQLNEDDYIDWLEQYDNADLINAVVDIAAVYNGQNTSVSEKKSEAGR